LKMILDVYNALLQLVDAEFKDICEDVEIIFSSTGRAHLPKTLSWGM